jgi:hypothetical protein
MSEHRGHLLPDTEDISAARRGHCRTARGQAATHLPVAGIGTVTVVGHLTGPVARYRSHVGRP